MGGAVGIPSNGLRLLDRLGVYQSLLQRGSSQSDFALHSGSGGILGQIDDFVSHSRAETGYGYMRVKRTDLVDVLLQAINEAGIPVYFGKRIIGIEDGEERLSVIFADGTTDSADILLGCDGIHSAVRNIYVDPDQKPEYSGLSVLFSSMPASKIPAASAAQIKGLTATMTSQGMFLSAPCTADRDEFFWAFSREVAIPDGNDSRDGWEVQRRQEVKGFKDTLHDVLGGAKGEWIDTLKYMIDQTNTIKFYPVYRLPLGGRWSRGRCVLIGDAAHAMQPHAGQGVSMALEDAFLISRLLADASRSVEDACESLHRIRKPRVEEVYRTAAENGEARKKTGPWGQWLKENIIWARFSIPWGLGGKMFGQTYAVYDIDEEGI